jgi:hypothetical protein
VILTDHEVFDLNVVLDHARYVLDTRHCLPSRPTVEYL